MNHYKSHKTANKLHVIDICIFATVGECMLWLYPIINNRFIGDLIFKMDLYRFDVTQNKISKTNI